MLKEVVHLDHTDCTGIESEHVLIESGLFSYQDHLDKQEIQKKKKKKKIPKKSLTSLRIDGSLSTSLPKPINLSAKPEPIS